MLNISYVGLAKLRGKSVLYTVILIFETLHNFLDASSAEKAYMVI